MSDTWDLGNPHILSTAGGWPEQLVARQQPDTQIKSLINVLIPAPASTHPHSQHCPGAPNIFVHNSSPQYLDMKS